MLLTAFLICLLIAILFFSFIIISTFVGFVTTRVPLVRSKEEDTIRVLTAAGIKDDAVFYELGSGDGAVIFLAERLKKIRGTGFEVTLWVHMWAKLKAKRNGSSATFIRANFFKYSWSPADMIYCFLFPPLMSHVKEKFLTECRPGTILISRDFALPDFDPAEKIEIDSLHTAYIYKR